mgnify:CR=1 FL=1
MTITEYVAKILNDRSKYDYISNNQLELLIEFADAYEKSFYLTVQSHKLLNKNPVKRKKGRYR